MHVPFFDLASQVQLYRKELHSKLDEIVDGGYFIGGQALDSFESEFSNYLSVRQAIGVGNGLDALRLILEGLAVGPGDEVIVPGFTFYATWLAVMQVGATPIFVDVESSSANLNPNLLKGALSSRTKAIIVVHLYGWPARMKLILDFAREHGIKVVEDAAQAHGASLDGEMAGSLSHAAAFSFYPTKNLGALGDAGVVATNDENLARLVRSRRSYGAGETKYDHQDFGWNSRLDTIQAGFLSIGLKKLEDWNNHRRAIASVYRTALGAVSNSIVGPEEVQDSAWHHFIVRCKDREQVRAILISRGVSTDIHYPYYSGSRPPVMSYLKKLGIKSTNDLGVSRRLSEEVISLPIGPWMSEGQAEFVAGVLSEIPPSMFSN
jgi:dTDP-4-amino-4,6-dideoxygalactose transaminase